MAVQSEDQRGSFLIRGVSRAQLESDNATNELESLTRRSSRNSQRQRRFEPVSRYDNNHKHSDEKYRRSQLKKAKHEVLKADNATLKIKAGNRRISGVEALKAENEALRGELGALKAETEALRGETTALKTRVDALEERSMALKAALEKVTKKSHAELVNQSVAAIVSSSPAEPDGNGNADVAGEVAIQRNEVEYSDEKDQLIREGEQQQSEPELRFKCDICDEAFPASGNLKTHMYSHTGFRPFPCEFCDERFLFIRELQKHLAGHGSQPYSCDHCGKRFGFKRSLISHQLSHSNDNPEIGRNINLSQTSEMESGGGMKKVQDRRDLLLSSTNSSNQHN